MGATAAVAIVIRKEQEMVRAFQARGATDPARGATLDSLNLHRGVAFRRLTAHAVIRPASGDDRYYLDEASWEAMRASRRRRIPIILGVVMIVMVVTVLFTYMAVRR